MKKKRLILIIFVILSFFILKYYWNYENYEENLERNNNKDINKQAGYPNELLDMLSRNSDMQDYVDDYLEKKGNVYADSIGEVEKGKFPLLLQYDKRWGYGVYGDNVLAINGCGPTVIAMAVAGLTGRSDVTPYTVATYAYENGYYTEEGGTSWSLMSDGVEYFGIKGNTIPLSKDIIFEELESGHPIACSMRKGDFTTTGHFILLVGIKDGKIVVNDSNSKERSNKLWTYDRLENQIKNLWVFEEL